jgi:phosphoribosyl-ATP pyrophosphohydrolase/phosphoribosyl-AMP cyclohydrolase
MKKEKKMTKVRMTLTQARKFANGLRYDAAGLVPVVAVEDGRGAVLMLAYANQAAVARTLQTGQAWFFSRSRQALWKKGQTSGNVMSVRSVWVDCDGDALIYRVKVRGESNACHLNRASCFERAVPSAVAAPVAAAPFGIANLDAVIEERYRKRPRGAYTTQLLQSRALMRKKILEETGELLEALEEKNKKEVVWEACDLIYHALVACRARGIRLADLEKELGRRAK